MLIHVVWCHYFFCIKIDENKWIKLKNDTSSTTSACESDYGKSAGGSLFNQHGVFSIIVMMVFLNF